jgi:hypothetical protein
MIKLSNIFGLDNSKASSEYSFSVSNGGTSVFLTVLGLSGSHFAKTDKEKDIILWLLDHDLEVRGFGNSGFDVCDMPWNYDTFEEEKAFLIKVIDGAKQKINWNTLYYEPNESRVFLYLDSFKNLITKLQRNQINRQSYKDWLELNSKPLFKNPPGYPKCKKHEILLYFNGCIACNDV